MSGSIHTLLLLPHLNIHNANALSSPFTIGFPALTAWLGAVHALQRQLNHKGLAVSFDGTGVACHEIDLQTYKGSGDFVYSIIGTGNPLGADSKRPSFIEEPRCHLDVSLIIELSGYDSDMEDALFEQVTHLLQSKIKVAGGHILSFATPQIMRVEDHNIQDMAKLTRQLMPGYVLTERRDLMVDAMEQGQDGLDALLDYLAIHHRADKDDKGEVNWRSYRKTYQHKPVGWVVPIATGFHGVSELGVAKNQRDPEAPHRFAESVVTLGAFQMPYHFHSVNDMLWRYYYDEANQLYLCQQGAQVSAEEYDEFAGL